jgi:thermitase
LNHLKTKIVLTISTVSVLMSTSPSVFSAEKKAKKEEFAKGHILVEAMGDVSDDDLTKILAVHKGKRRKIGKSRIHFVDLPTDTTEEEMVAKLSHDPRIKFAELDKKIESTFVPNDPYFGNEWHLPKINTIAAWDGAQGAGITIAILDSGVDPTHPDLVPNLVAGYNFYDNNTNTSDVCGHGTAVAGVAAAKGNNSLGVSGVAPQAKIMPIRIAYKDAATGSCYGYYSTITSGLNWAADHGAKIANISYGGVAGSASIISAAQNFKSKGGLVFVSAGNSNIDENITPTTSMIAVSATDSNDQKASWSSYGNFVALSAPGTGIWTTSNGGIYQGWNGTSFSSPLTAGVGALLMSANRNLTAAQVENIMFTTALDLGNAGRDNLFGYGRVDAAVAMRAALNTTAPVGDTQAPTVSFLSPANNTTVSKIVAVSLNAADNVGVTKVEFLVNGKVVQTDSIAPYAFSWDSKTLTNGTASLSLIAYDAAGNKTTSSPLSVNVSNVIADTTAPVVKIINPVAGSRVSGVVAVRFSATDNSGTAGITLSLLIDNVLIGSLKGGSLNYNWNVTYLKTGIHKVEARAKDAAGNTSVTSVTVTK